MRSIFFTSRGVRPGWRILAWLVLFALPSAVLAAVSMLAPKNVNFETLFPDYVKGLANPFELASVEGFLLLSVTFATAVMARLEHRAFGTYGVPWRLAFRGNFWRGALLGFITVSLTVAIIALAGGITFNAPQSWNASAILVNGLLWAGMFVIGGLAEESLFRGYLQYTLGSSIGFWPAAGTLSVLFAAPHVRNLGETPLGLISIVIFGLFFCLLLWLTGNLWLAIGFHATWDWGQTFFYGIPDSGLEATRSLFRSTAAGPSWISGGTTGPEASVVCFLMLAAVAALLWHYRRGRPAAASSA